MPPRDDLALLNRYTIDRTDAAFAELVRRHLDLVYAAARRQVLTASAAEDIAQLVFTDLAQNPPALAPGSSLVAWLHTVTRRTAIDFIRRETRRRDREHAALALDAMHPPPSDWSAIAPLLDEAVATLDEPDRTAILLRFFENQSFREVGAALGLSDDAAQKRVSRALDDLRVFFTRRGLALTAAGLLADLSAHACEAAPAQLAATVATLAAAPATGSAALAKSAATLAMTTTQKVLVSFVLAAALGTTLYEASVISRQRAELTALQQRTENLARDLAALHRDRAAAADQLAEALRQLTAERAKSAKFAAADPAIEAALDEWLQNVVRLKQTLEKTPSSQIPELRYLTAKDWLDATKENSLATDLDVRRALNQLRTVAKQHFAGQMTPALKRYLAANHDQPPVDPAQLAPFFDQPIDPALLARYGTFPTGNTDALGLRFTGRNGEPATWVIREKESVDPYYDSTVQLYADGTAFGGRSTFDLEIDAAVKSFRAAHPNAAPATPAQLAPYLHSAIDPAFIQQRLDLDH